MMQLCINYQSNFLKLYKFCIISNIWSVFQLIIIHPQKPSISKRTLQRQPDRYHHTEKLAKPFFKQLHLSFFHIIFFRSPSNRTYCEGSISCVGTVWRVCWIWLRCIPVCVWVDHCVTIHPSPGRRRSHSGGKKRGNPGWKSLGGNPWEGKFIHYTALKKWFNNIFHF